MVDRLAVAALAVSLSASPLCAQQGSFLVRLGDDTLAVENYQIKARQLEVYQLFRSPRTVLRHYVVELGRNGAVTRAMAAVYRPYALDHAIQQVTVTYRGDSATWTTRRGDSTVTRTVAVPAGAVPLIVPPYALLNLVTMRARRAGRDSVSVMAQVSAAPAFAVPVIRLGSDSMLVDLPFGPVRARVDREGHYLGSEAPDATEHHLVTAVRRVDIRKLALAFARRDSAGQALGELSPRDTARATVAGADLMVDYGRPLKRGREIFGGIVPWGRVWRTGANAATQLHTGRDLVIGGAAVPAGTYTLWTIPDATGWKLIINRETGQWGTAYHPAQDLVRVDMQTGTLTVPVEQFTISIVPEVNGGQLQMEWDRTVASVRFSVR